MKEPGGDVNKLPRWARDHIERLQRQRDEVVRQRDQMMAPVTDTTRAFIRSSVNQTERALSAYEDVVFRVGREQITVSLRGDAVEVRSFEGLVVRPFAINCIEVSGRER